jgi:hypothetical protein
MRLGNLWELERGWGDGLVGTLILLGFWGPGPRYKLYDF